ncbi:MAG: FAD-dependent thymidylate synthase [Proteobacteria bacterium]|nr:FAD-dependent thymidylate synthase [Pseudomonadota bacterium]
MQPRAGQRKEDESVRDASEAHGADDAALAAAREAEIAEQRAETRPTLRATVPALEELLYKELPVLDHGFVRVVDYLGDDGAIVQSARVSYGKGTKTVSNDRGLIRYLMRHRHTTPFEMCEIKLHVKLPMFVARQWIRHRTANVNEYSARYSILDHEFYVPASPDLATQSSANRQGRAEALSGAEAEQTLNEITSESDRAYALYTKLLNETAAGDVIDPERLGLARELARMVLPVNYYTQWYWKIDLYNLLHFLSLRADAHAQYEIRAYADVLCDVVAKWVPLVWEAFEDYRMTGANISGPGLEALKEMLDEATLADQEKLDELRKRSGMSPREFRELMATLGRGS